MTPEEILAAADALGKPGRSSRAYGWPRVVAVLARHAIGSAAPTLALCEPSMERCTCHAQLLCLTSYRSRALPPTPVRAARTGNELREFLDVADRFAAESAAKLPATVSRCQRVGHSRPRHSGSIGITLALLPSAPIAYNEPRGVCVSSRDRWQYRAVEVFE